MSKLRSLLRTITSGFRLLLSNKVPSSVKIGAFAVVLFYFLMLLDLVSDFFPILGWVDDLTLLYLVFRFLEKRYGSKDTKNANVIDVENSDIVH